MIRHTGIRPEFLREEAGTFERLRQEVKWLRKAEDRELLNEAYGNYARAHYLVEEAKRSRSSMLWNLAQLEESLWWSVKRILQNKGYDRRMFIRENGKVGLIGHYPIFPAIPVVYDDIILTYDEEERMDKPIPVMLDGKCALVLPDGLNKALTGFDYELIFREPWGEWGNYMALKDGHWGILGPDGKERVPCIMDHIYERTCGDGVIILEKDGLFGVFNDVEYVYPEYEAKDIERECEGMVRVRKNGNWGWLDKNGRYTLDRSKACFSNYDDDEK